MTHKPINIDHKLRQFFESIAFSKPLEFNGDLTPQEIIESYPGLSQAPICKFSRRYPGIDEMQSAFFSLISAQIHLKVAGWRPTAPISYLISELICNIQEHSHCSCGYMILLSPPENDNLSICIADNGITIHGSYVESGKKELIRLIGSNHAEALRFAAKGISTKNRPDSEGRGYGISTNLKMVVNGLQGSFIMLSGNAFFRYDENGEQFVNLPKGMNWDGTIILVNIPLKQKSDCDVYQYIS